MKAIPIFSILIIATLLSSCNQRDKTADVNIIFLHHSTGEVIWNGSEKSRVVKAIERISIRLANLIGGKAHLPKLFNTYNKEHLMNYEINEMNFPKASPYGWNNYAFDYYNIWVKNTGEKPFMEEPTLEILSKEYQVIIFKHCFPSSNIIADLDSADINSDIKTISNYKLQYIALRNKLQSFPKIKFILWTGAVQVESLLLDEEATRAQKFNNWVINEWDQPGDNIFLWDFYNLQTEGGLYFKEEYAVSSSDSHPNQKFAGIAVELLFNRIIDVIENNGERTLLTGELK